VQYSEGNYEISLNTIANHSNNFNEVIIRDICILSEYQQNGIGKKIVEHFLNISKCSVIWLISLPPAVNFWKKFGAKFIKESSYGYLMVINQ
jgi:predicted acetyltransferase